MAAGRLVYVSDPALDFLGEMRLDLPWAARTMGNGFFRLQALTSIIESGGDFTFDLRELDYELEAGFRFRTAGPVQFAFSLAQTGKEQVDRNGEPLIRTLEVGLQSREFPLLQPQARWRWSVKTGLVVGKRETGADGRFEGEVHYRTDLGRVAWGLDGVLDGLYNRDDASFRADLELGPRFGFLLPGSQRIDFFIHYLRGSNPLGLRLTGVLVGVDLGQAFRPAGPRRPPVAMEGLVEAGGGEGHLAGRFLLLARSMELAGGRRLILGVDGNTLTGRPADQLYYRYQVGLEQPLHSGVAGFYFHHRSNHHLSQPGDPVTSINVLEGGYRSAFWNRLPPPEPALRWGRLDWLGRAGFLISSSFGEDRRWHLRSGARWSAGTAHRSWRPFVQVEAEAGDVSSQQFQIGLLHSTGVDLHLEFRNDRQFFGEDQTALLLASTKHF